MNEKSGENRPSRTGLILIFAIMITLIFLGGALLVSILGGSSAIMIFDDGQDDVTVPPLSSYEVELDNGYSLEVEILSSEEIDVFLVERNLDPPDDDIIESWNDVTETTIDQDIPSDGNYFLTFKNSNIAPVDVEYQYSYYDEEKISGMFSYPFYCSSGLFLMFIVLDLLLLVKYYIDKRTS